MGRGFDPRPGHHFPALTINNKDPVSPGKTDAFAEIMQMPLDPAVKGIHLFQTAIPSRNERSAFAKTPEKALDQEKKGHKPKKNEKKKKKMFAFSKKDDIFVGNVKRNKLFLQEFRLDNERFCGIKKQN